MNVRQTLENLGQMIKEVYPKMSDVVSGSEIERKNQRAIVSDIQMRLAEIYAIIQREIANDDLDLDYADAVKKYPQRMESILHLISVLALTVKTKLNIGEFQKLFNPLNIKKIDKVCFECYQVKSILSGKPDTNARAVYDLGVSSTLEYQDYKTTFGKRISPARSMPGRLTGSFMCTPQMYSEYQSMIDTTRTNLDQMFRAPSLEERTLWTMSSPSDSSLVDQIKTKNQIKSLKQLSAQKVIHHRAMLFKDLAKLPTAITEVYPELDINYQHKFAVKVKKVLTTLTFTPDEKEQAYLDRMFKALESKNPYNTIHPILVEMGKTIQVGFLSMFKDHMQPIRTEILRLMAEYNTDKQEYIRYFGKGL